MDEKFDTTEEGLTSRAPRQRDLAALGSELNRLGAEYIVIGGFAIILSGYPLGDAIQVLPLESLANAVRS